MIDDVSIHRLVTVLLPPSMPVTEKDLLAQICLPKEVGECKAFAPNRFRCNFCTGCGRLINKHAAEIIPDNNTLRAALEYSQQGEMMPSCVLPLDPERGRAKGALYLGGFKAAMNHEFLKQNNIGHVLNTAVGLEKVFGPKYTQAIDKAKSMGVTFLLMNWTDSESFVIPQADLCSCVEFIHDALASGSSVLVHCAQGKSRSATAVIAYVMASKGLTVQESLAFVREARKMADPNPKFLEILEEFEGSRELGHLRAKISL